jgi:uncharacterized protein (TIGR00251 family)
MDLHIKVKPNARQNRIILENGNVAVHVKAPPAEGQANKALVIYLSEIFSVPRSKIAIAAGAGSRFKKITIPTEFDENIRKVLAGFANK